MAIKKYQIQNLCISIQTRLGINIGINILVHKMQEFMQLNHRGNLRKRILNPLVSGGLLKLTIPDKPTSPNQKYYSDKI